MVLTEVWDMPEVGCCVLARPTKKMGLYRQMVGRVLRPAPGKIDAIIIDHSGAVFRHGFAEDRVTWTLDPDRYAESFTHAKRCAPDSVSRVLECSSVAPSVSVVPRALIVASSRSGRRARSWLATAILASSRAARSRRPA
jgi:superfamily II DNA or RNA helicase